MAGIVANGSIRREAEWNVAEVPDEDLLDHYLTATEPDSQEAFRELVVRHGPMVLGICRHVLNQAQDAEDAFQATFLALARKGATIRDRRVLSGWLHEVAYRIAVRSRSSAARRRALERQGLAMFPPDSEPDDQGERAAWNELRPVLHEEVNRLPDKYRIPVILSYLEGRTNEEVAELLRWPVGTVKGRLSRARELLRSRLSRRGLALSAAFLMTALSRGRVFAEAVPSDLVQRTVRLALAPRPLGGPTDATDPEEDHPAIEPTDTSARGPLRIARIALIGFLFLFIFSVAIGSAAAVVGTGGSLSEFRSLTRLFGFRPQLTAPAGSSHCR